MKDTQKLFDFFQGVDPSDLEVLVEALQVASEEDSDLEPTQIRDMVPVRSWLRSRYFNAMSRNLYDYWEHEIVSFCEEDYEEWVISGSIGTGKSTAALIAAQRKIYEMSCWDYPQRLFRLADMTKIFFAYLSVNLKQADLTGFGQIREMIDATPYFRNDYKRDMGINSVLKFPRGIFMIPGSDTISVIGTNLFGTILDEANFLRKSGMSEIGDVSKAQDLYAETTDRRRSRFMYKGKDPGFSILVSSSTVQTSFTSSRIKKADEKTKVTITRLWDVKPGAYSDRTFFVFNGSDKDDPFIITHPNEFNELLSEPETRERVKEEAEVCCLEGEALVAYAVDILPDYLYDAVSEVPVDFKRSFESDLFKALRNIAGVSIAPVGKLFSSRMLWNRACSYGLRHPFRKKMVSIGLQSGESLDDFFLSDMVFETYEDDRKRMKTRPVVMPYAPRYIHIDQSKNTCRAAMACVHRAGHAAGFDILSPIVELDFLIVVDPPKPPDVIALHKFREFVLFLRRMGMKIGKVTYDQYQSEEPIQMLTLQKVEAGLLSVDRNDKPYQTLVSLFRECRVRIYDQEILKRELFNLDWDRGHAKVDHPEKNPDGTEGSKDATDALCGACYSCVFGEDNLYIERKDALSKVMVSSPRTRQDKREDFSWVLPKEYRDKVKVEVDCVGGDEWQTYLDLESF